MPERAVFETASRYNGAIAEMAIDPEHGKAASFLQKLDRAPYYAVNLEHNTGGQRRA